MICVCSFQGDALSPLLFNIALDNVTRIVQPWYRYRRAHKINTFGFADDANIIGNHKESIVKNTVRNEAKAV